MNLRNFRKQRKKIKWTICLPTATMEGDHNRTLWRRAWQ